MILSKLKSLISLFNYSICLNCSGFGINVSHVFSIKSINHFYPTSYIKLIHDIVIKILFLSNRACFMQFCRRYFGSCNKINKFDSLSMAKSGT